MKIVAIEKKILVHEFPTNSFNFKIKKEQSFYHYSVACNNG